MMGAMCWLNVTVSLTGALRAVSGRARRRAARIRMAPVMPKPNQDASDIGSRLNLEGGFGAGGAGGQIDGKDGALADLGVGVEGAAAFLEQSLHDAEAETGAHVAGLRSEVGLEDLRHHFRRNSGTVVLDGERQDGGDVLESIPVDEAILRTILKEGKIEWMKQELAANFHGMVHVRALQRVDGEVEENLDQVSAVDLHHDVFGQGVNEELVVLGVGMDF